MSMKIKILNPKLILLLDNLFGLRAWGLILYGVLPANLALLGVLQVKVSKILNELLPYFLVASILPILLTFLLIRAKHKEWYITVDFLNIRATFATVLILLFATIVCGASGIIQGKYKFYLPGWTGDDLKAIAESFLMAVVTLVVSSTFFITALTKNANLPGLPTTDFVGQMTKIRNNMRALKNSKFWTKYMDSDYVETDNRLIDLAKGIGTDMELATTHTGNSLARKSIEPIKKDITNLINVLQEIQSSSGEDFKKKLWRIYFEDPKKLSENEKIRRSSNSEKLYSLEMIRRLKFGA